MSAVLFLSILTKREWENEEVIPYCKSDCGYRIDTALDEP